MPVDRKSGLYARTIQGYQFELRLDIDGDQPQNQVSVSLLNRFPSHWIALVADEGPDTWTGDIWYRHNNADDLRVKGQVPNRFTVKWGQDGQDEFVVLSFRRNTTILLDLRLDRSSDFFRGAEFELDHEQSIPFPTEYNTHDHPDRPNDLAQEDLSLQSIYARAGVEVTFTAGGNDFTNVAVHGFEEKTRQNDRSFA